MRVLSLSLSLSLSLALSVCVSHSIASQDITLFYRFCVFVTLEHCLLALKSGLALIIPDVPFEVTLQLERSEFLVSKVIMDSPDEQSDILGANESGKIRAKKVRLPDLTVLGNDDDFVTRGPVDPYADPNP